MRFVDSIKSFIAKVKSVFFGDKKKMDTAAQVSVGANKGNVPDVGARHGEKASDGWNYRTAYFRDFDGKYYECRISVMV